MKKKANKSNRLRKYRKTIVYASFNAMLMGFMLAYFIAADRLRSMKLGEYPDMPRAIIVQNYNEARPSIIVDSILIGLLITLIFFLLNMLIMFKIKHNINLIKAFIQYIKRRKNNN
ncbi:hypothetical protein EDC19_0703 [Natranaerovirga hydrolytica]|uniref:Uncharacterized protein n=1 Tax=Natranaerovirga hydrolytica TaxID=680378 RepID=A0A4R1N6M1_9FIRM|nr:hypothetical protein [Natranaerovirga hydrolytica]TCK98283.1 hypothetical protein EDC19_0703 [Natranaerovirga hydrolytica]